MGKLMVIKSLFNFVFYIGLFSSYEGFFTSSYASDPMEDDNLVPYKLKRKEKEGKEEDLPLKKLKGEASNFDMFSRLPDDVLKIIIVALCGPTYHQIKWVKTLEMDEGIDTKNVDAVYEAMLHSDNKNLLCLDTDKFKEECADLVNLSLTCKKFNMYLKAKNSFFFHIKLLLQFVFLNNRASPAFLNNRCGIWEVGFGYSNDDKALPPFIPPTYLSEIKDRKERNDLTFSINLGASVAYVPNCLKDFSWQWVTLKGKKVIGKNAFSSLRGLKLYYDPMLLEEAFSLENLNIYSLTIMTPKISEESDTIYADIPPTIDNLKKLQSLHLHSCNLRELPRTISKMTNLRQISIPKNAEDKWIIEGPALEFLEKLYRQRIRKRDIFTVQNIGATGNTSILNEYKRKKKKEEPSVKTMSLFRHSCQLRYPKRDRKTTVRFGDL